MPSKSAPRVGICIALIRSVTASVNGLFTVCQSNPIPRTRHDPFPPPFRPPLPFPLVNFGAEFYATHKVSQATFQKALDQFGAQQLVELTSLMGHYAQTSFILNAFGVDAPEQRTEPLLPV